MDQNIFEQIGEPGEVCATLEHTACLVPRTLKQQAVRASPAPLALGQGTISPPPVPDDDIACPPGASLTLPRKAIWRPELSEITTSAQR